MSRGAGSTGWFVRTQEFGLVLAIAAAVLITLALDWQDRAIIQPANIKYNLLQPMALLGVFAVGEAVVIIAGGIDLSVGSVIAFAGLIYALTIQALQPRLAGGLGGSWAVLILAALATLLVGWAIGGLHALLIVTLDLPPFIATLATLAGLRSAAQIIQQSPVSVRQPLYRGAGEEWWITLAIYAAVAVVVGVIMRRTVLGRHLYALGGNESAARLSGLRTGRLKLIAYSISAVLAAAAGILYAGRSAQGYHQTGLGYELDAIAAAVVGGCSLNGGVGTILGTVLGVALLRVVINAIGLVIQRESTTWEGLVVGVVIILAVAVNRWRRRGLE